jgi:acetophenone carboxylase
MKQQLDRGDRTLPHKMGDLYDRVSAESGDRIYADLSAPPKLFLEGDTLYVPVTGGAGYGDVLERAPESVIGDLRNGVVTTWAARHIYGVVHDEDTLLLRAQETELLRSEIRAARLKRAKPFHAFNKEWQMLKPREEVLLYYGSFPHPESGTTDAAVAV